MRSHACALVPGAVVTRVNQLSSSARLTALPRDQTEGSGASEAVLCRVAHLALGHIWWATLQSCYVSIHGAVALSTAKALPQPQPSAERNGPHPSAVFANWFGSVNIQQAEICVANSASLLPLLPLRSQ